MKVFRPPASIGESPDIMPLDTYAEREAEWLDKLRAWIKANWKPHRLAGKRIAIPYADSAAYYMVADGRTLIWLPLGDGWNVPTYMTRGLRVTDIERMVT